MTKIFSCSVFYKILVIVLFCGLFTFSQNVFSQTEESYFLDDQGTTFSPQLYINNIVVNKPAVAGEELTGTFYLHNVGQQTAGNVSHQASIVMLQEVSGKFYPIDFVSSGNFSDKYAVPQGKHEKEFKINIPSSVPDGYKLGIYIETFIEDQPNTYESIPIEIKGGTSGAVSGSAKTIEFVSFYGELNINDEKFFPLEGPTLQKGENINLAVEVSKNSSYSEIIPKLSIYAGNKVEGNPVDVLNYKVLSLNSKTAVKDVYSLPVDLDPGVYTARLYYTNKEGVVVSSFLDARYIIPGLKPKIDTITYNNLDQNLIDSFDVIVSYADVPLSARIGKDGNFLDPRATGVFVKEGQEEFIGVENNLINGISLRVSLIDTATKKEIDSKIIDDFAVSLSNPVTFNFKPISKVESVTVVVSMDKDGEFVDQKESVIQVIPKDSNNIFSMFFENVLAIYIAGAVLIILLVVLLLKYFKSSKAKSFLSALLIIGMSIVGSIFIVSNPIPTQAGQVYLGTATVISPKPPAVESYEAGSLIDFSARYNFTYCANVMPAAKGAITQPVPVGSAHTAFGPERPSSVTLGRATGSSDAQYRYSFNSTYTQSFIAPSTPGTYKFKYKVGIRNAQRTDRFLTGEVIFSVRPNDVCTNINDMQTDVPSGYFQTFDENGRSVCLDTNVDMMCSVSKNPASVGDAVTFNATTRSNTRGDFSWFSGNSTNNPDNLLKKDNNVTSSSLSQTLGQSGVYQVSALFNGENGESNNCTVGVTVYPDLIAPDPGSVTVFINPSAPAGVVNLNLDRSITNSTCKATWTATHVVGCQLFNNNEPVEDVGVTGSKDVSPGSYEVRCLQVKNGTVAKSATRVCRENPDLQEN